MATSDLDRGDRRGNNPDPFKLDFTEAGLAVKPVPQLGAVEIRIRSAGSRPITLVLAVSQAKALGRLLMLHAAVVEVVDREGRP
jgi:hypothetical protein